MLLINEYKRLLRKALGLEEGCSDSKMVVSLIQNSYCSADEIKNIIRATKFNKKDLMTLCLSDEEFYFNYLPEEYKESKAFMLEFLRKNFENNGLAPLEYINYISPKLKSDLSFMKELVKIDGYVITDESIINTPFYNSTELRETANEYFTNNEGITYLVKDIESLYESVCKKLNDLNNSYNFSKSQGVKYDDDYKKQMRIYNKNKIYYAKQLELLKSLDAYKTQSKNC